MEPYHWLSAFMMQRTVMHFSELLELGLYHRCGEHSILSMSFSILVCNVGPPLGFENITVFLESIL
jgi:hypothetical protein